MESISKIASAKPVHLSYKKFRHKAKAKKYISKPKEANKDNEDTEILYTHHFPHATYEPDRENAHTIKAETNERLYDVFKATVESNTLKQLRSFTGAIDEYWSSEKTSDRFIDFAKALSSNNNEKADLLKAAFQHGFQSASKQWGSKLPPISQHTHDLTIQKFNNWLKERLDDN